MKRISSHSLPVLIFLGALVVYPLTALPLSRHLAARPVEEKLGYVPSAQALRPMSAGFKELVGSGLVMKARVYFGALFEPNPKRVQRPPDFPGMSRMLHGAVKLDPYNMDAYYFAQAFLVWDVGQVGVANDLLDYGMQHRTWDWYLPFFAGFNHAYFLKEYDKAAVYYRRVADLTGNSLSISLTGRYLQESGQTELAIGYLRGMLATARDELARKSFATRLKAFEEVRRIEQARDRYQQRVGRLPESLDELLKGSYLAPPPIDPYGGKFFLDETGKVATTSKFAFGAGGNKGTDEKH